MTLNDIMVSALKQLNRGHDPQTLDTWRAEFTTFANDAAQDIAQAVGLRRTDQLVAAEGAIDLAKLPRRCEKVLAVMKDGKPVRFTLGEGSSSMRVEASGEVNVAYKYAPQPLSNPTDVPEVPAHAHGLITTYVVARERAAQDVSMQRGANVYFELYQAGKARLRKHNGEQDAYALLNRW